MILICESLKDGAVLQGEIQGSDAILTVDGIPIKRWTFEHTIAAQYWLQQNWHRLAKGIMA